MHNLASLRGRNDSMSNFQIDPSYQEVAERMKVAREIWPECIFRAANPLVPFHLVEIAGVHYIIYTAALYRNSTDQLPAIGTAWEEVPGRTPYTKGSELMNAETSAWGRACVAAGIPAKKIASFEEVRNRQTPPEIKRESAGDINTSELDAWNLSTVVKVIDAWNCIHGPRIVREGEKNGRAYYGMACSKTLNSGVQCETNWFVLNAAGKWVPKLASVE